MAFAKLSNIAAQGGKIKNLTVRRLAVITQIRDKDRIIQFRQISSKSDPIIRNTIEPVKYNDRHSMPKMTIE
jgi:hypothetical protein